MYTFGILAAFFLLLSGIIFGKRIKQNQPMVALIVVAGTLIGSIIVNGILGLSLPYQEVDVKTKLLKESKSKIYTPTDTTMFYSYIRFIYKFKADKEEPDYSYVDINLFGDIHSKSSEKVEIKFLPEGDSIPHVKVFRAKRFTDNKWVSQFGLPSGGKHYIAYIPNDSIHNFLIDQLNDKFYIKDEDTKIAQSN